VKGLLYTATLKGILGNYMFAREDKCVLMEMLHSCTTEDNKKCILESFQNVNGTIRILVATIAFGMGVDCKAVHRVIHYGPSKTIDAYVQETGRAGRDVVQSSTLILYHGILLNHVDMNIKSFVKTKDCRRKTVLNHFEADCELNYHFICIFVVTTVHLFVNVDKQTVGSIQNTQSLIVTRMYCLVGGNEKLAMSRRS
jgi:superfamily II DNA helicase RecQ